MKRWPVIGWCSVLLLLAIHLSSPLGAQTPAPPLGRLRGEVKTPAQKPIPGATVVAVRVEGPPVLALTATDGQGFLALDQLAAGVWTLYVRGVGFSPGRLDGLRVGGPFRAVADLVLQPGTGGLPPVKLPPGEGSPSLSLTVTDPDGKPLPGVLARVEPVGQVADPVEGRTDSRGRQNLAMAGPGRWRLVLFRAGYSRLVIPDWELTAGQVSVLARLQPLVEGAQTPLEELLPPPKWTR